MNAIRIPALAFVALLFVSAANAETDSVEEIERSLFTLMFLSKDYERSRLAVRILGQTSRTDDSTCDLIAERLLKSSKDAQGVAIDAIAWYVATIRDHCSQRYRNALVQARKRYKDEAILRHFGRALALPPDESVEQYREGAVNLAAVEKELQQRLVPYRRSAKPENELALGITFGDALQVAGAPRDLSGLTLRFWRYARSSLLVAHYDGIGMLIFRRGSGGVWSLVDIIAELNPIGEAYQGENFAMAQALSCLRGEAFREYVKLHHPQFRTDSGALWALARRLARTPFPADRFEEDGMLVAIKVIVNSRDAQTIDMLKLIGDSADTHFARTAGAYARRLDRKRQNP
jgi:hypothetical protein